MSEMGMNPLTFVLARGELASFPLRGREYGLSCVEGRLWVTAGGEDLVLEPGSESTITGRGTVVVEALRKATVRVEVRTPARAGAGDPVPLGRLPDGLFQ